MHVSHYVSKTEQLAFAKHLDRYLEEFEWRFNQRDNPYLFRDTMRRLIATEKLEYKELTA